MLATTLLAATLSVGPIQLEPCFVEGSRKSLSCATLTVPESYRDENSQAVELHIVRAESVAKQSRSPLFILAGGPGQAATEMTSMLVNAFEEVVKQHDVVFVAQRGSGLSQAQPCHNKELLTTQDVLNAFSECQEKIKDVTHQLSTDVLVDDIDSVRQALGYNKISLWGGSYGTFAAQHYANKYTQHVDKLILDAVVPLNGNPLVDGGRYPQQSLDRLDTLCQQDTDCSAHFPDWKAQFYQLLDKTRHHPIKLKFGQKQISVDHILLSQLVRTALYVPRLSAKLPMALTRANQGDSRQLSALNQMVAGAATDTMYLGLTLGVLCQEHVYAGQAEKAKLAAKGSFTQDHYYRYWMQGCNGERTAQANYIQAPKQLTTPTLLVSGELDPITPEQNTHSASQFFTDYQHIVIPNAGHTNSHLGCMPKLLKSFLLEGEVKDTACIEQNRFPPFITDGQ